MCNAGSVTVLNLQLDVLVRFTLVRASNDIVAGERLSAILADVAHPLMCQ